MMVIFTIFFKRGHWKSGLHWQMHRQWSPFFDFDRTFMGSALMFTVCCSCKKQWGPQRWLNVTEFLLVCCFIWTCLSDINAPDSHLRSSGHWVIDWIGDNVNIWPVWLLLLLCPYFFSNFFSNGFTHSFAIFLLSNCYSPHCPGTRSKFGL